MSGSDGFVVKYDPVADSFTNFGPVGPCNFLDHIHFHSDGFVYTTCLDGNHIFQIDPVGGGITTFLVPTANSATAGITGDVNGDLWTIERSAHNVVHGDLANMVPNTSNGVTEFAIPDSHAPETVKACGDKVWFTGLGTGPNGPRVNNIDINTNVITLVDVDPGVGEPTYGLVIDGNGNPFATNPNAPKIYGIDTSAGNAVTVYPTPSTPHHIALSPTTGNLWYTDLSRGVVQLVPDEPLPATCEPTEPREPIAVEKTWTHTDYNWGLVCDDPLATVDDDRCVLADGTDVGPARQANINIPGDDVLADPLDQDANDKYKAFAQVHNNNKFQNTNPGAFYALTTIDVLSDVDGLTVWENYGDCTDQNPAQGPDAMDIKFVSKKDTRNVKVAIADPDGDVTEITGEIYNGIGGAITSIDDDSAHVDVLRDIPAGSMVYVLVKFQDDLKGFDTGDGNFDAMCDNNEIVDVLDENGDTVFSTQADAALRISNVP